MKKKWKIVIYCILTVLIVVYLFSNRLVYSVIGYLRDKPYSVPTYMEGKKYKYAIVLGGFGYMDPETEKIRFGEGYIKYRLLKALELWDKGVVEKILITGDGTSCIRPDGSSDRNLFLDHMFLMGYPRDIFVIEPYATTTYENALLTCGILNAQGVEGEDCILVTSSYHMMRGLACFKRLGFDMPYCCSAYRKKIDFKWRYLLPDRDVYRGWKITLHEWGGMVNYWWNGYI